MLSSGAAVVCIASLGTTVISSTLSGASASSKTQVVLAERPTTRPNFIFPYFSASYFTIANLYELDYLLFRPLYWVGGPASVTLNERLSIGKTPAFSHDNRTVEISLKGYKWSNGSKVDAEDVLFWMNIWKAKPTGYGAWFPGGLSMPTSVKAVRITNPTTLTITLDRSFNPHWLLYNQLSQITPLPLTWTKTSSSAKAGSAGCATAAFGTADAACVAVYDYLSKQAGYNPVNPKTTGVSALSTYATNPLWKVVDGPWTLTSFGATSNVVFEPNAAYSGPNKPRVKKYIEEPFTSGSAEYNALVAGDVDIGDLPTTEITSPAAKAATPGSPLKIGANNPRLSTYSLAPFYLWGVRYYPYNFKSNGDTGEAGRLFLQLYIRQALQHLVNQTLYVSRIYQGYAYPDYGPVPTLPKNPDASKAELVNPYPYSPGAAEHLLSSHGWKVIPGGTDVCEKPGSAAGDCGAGIKKGAKLAITLAYFAGTSALKTMMTAEKASWSLAGIHVSLTSGSVDDVFGQVTPCPKGCSWEVNGPIGWVYSPDPTGEENFASGASSNYGLFTTQRSNALIRATNLSNVNLTQYENYLEKSLPVLWQPEPVTLYEVRKGLKGAIPTDPLNSVTPATYYWS